ncbi:DUF1801 domain-containing protein [Microbacterium sp.]|uniref:DUF1801 domain-containing protein n=1 Tax=Microbacterium sp. TaxID=51671 RepID=UPI003C70DC85
MEPTGGSVAAFVAGVTPAIRRRDAETLIALMAEITGRDPELWGTIIGFGSCHYRYATGREGDMPILAFAPRKAASTVYLGETAAHTEALERLGPHTASVGCLYLKDLERVDETVLRGILEADYAATTSGRDDTVTITG